MDLRAVRFAVTLSEELHFGRAAQRHYISAQPFGQRVRQLERELGFALFERTSRRVSLTSRGEAFVAKAREALVHFEELGRKDAAPAADDALLVGILGFGLAELWRSARRSFQLEAPQARLTHRDLDLVNQYRLVQSGDVDAGIVFYLGPIEGLVFDLVYYAPRVAVVPAWSDLARQDFLHASDLEGQRWVPMASTSTEMTDWLGPAAATDARHPEALRRPEAVPSVVGTTGAVGLHAAPAARYYPSPDVRYVPTEGPGCHVAVATRVDDERPAVQALRRVISSAVAVRTLA